MAKKSIIARELKESVWLLKYAEKRKQLKEAGNYEELDKMPRNSAKIRLHNRCKLTGRPKGYMRDFGLCRVMFRKWLLKAKIPGITKSSW